MRIAAVLCSFCLSACGQTPPLQVDASGRGQDCSLRLNGVELSRDALRLDRLQAMRANHGNKAVVDFDLETPYRCIGGVIFDLQRAGFQVVALTVNGVPISTP